MPTWDALLGRQSLKERIASLEEERDRLASQLEAERERRRTAVRDRQAAEERINHLEDRVAGLEGELERLRGDEDEVAWHRVERFDHRGIGPVLDRLASLRTGPEAALSAAVSDAVPDPVRGVFGERAPLIQRTAPCLVYADDAGVLRAVLAPPRQPDAFLAWDDRFRIDPAWMQPVGTGRFALVRADRFALGRYEDGELEYDRGFISEVMSRHSKGGFSQARFERRRDEQVDEHVDRCRSILAELADDPLILVGDRRIVSRLGEFAAGTRAVDASGDPEDALGEAFREYWTTRLYVP